MVKIIGGRDNYNYEADGGGGGGGGGGGEVDDLDEFDMPTDKLFQKIPKRRKTSRGSIIARAITKAELKTAGDVMRRHRSK